MLEGIFATVIVLKILQSVIGHLVVTALGDTPATLPRITMMLLINKALLS